MTCKEGIVAFCTRNYLNSDFSREIDAIRPDVVRTVDVSNIGVHIDADQIKAAHEIERHERELLEDIRSRL